MRCYVKPIIGLKEISSYILWHNKLIFAGGEKDLGVQDEIRKNNTGTIKRGMET